SGRFALSPELVAGSAVKGHVPKGLSAIPCVIVHEAEHQDFAAAGVLHNCGNQALHFVEVNFHKALTTKDTMVHEGSRLFVSHGCLPSESNKKPAERLRFSGPVNLCCWLTQPH